MKEFLRAVRGMCEKFAYITRGYLYLIRKHKLVFLAPLLLMLVLLSFLVYYIGPAVIVSFIYAGV